MKNVAVLGCTLNIAFPIASITTSPSTTVTCDGKGVYYDKIEVVIVGYGSPTITDNNGGGKGYIKGSAKNVFVDGKPVLLEGDSVTINVKGTSGGGQSPASEDVTVKIVSAGQVSVQAD